jgi:restriction system protein
MFKRSVGKRTLVGKRFRVLSVALAGKKASKGIFITTSSFNDNATTYAAGLNQKVILVDGRRLSELMIEHGIGVTEQDAYSIKKIDSDYFDDA